MSARASGGPSRPGARTPPPRARRPAGSRPPLATPAKRKPPARGGRRTWGRGPWWRRPAVLGPLALLVAGAVIAVVASSGGGSSATAAGYKVGTVAVYGGKGPEGIPLEAGAVLAPANPSLTSASVDGVACGAMEQLTVHYHTHLLVVVDGQPRSVPPGVGMVPPAIVQQTPNGQYASGSNTCLFWLHTHAQDGIIHIEAPASRQFVLRQFFDIWGQPIGPGQVASAKGPVTATVDGQPYAGDPGNIVLSSHRQIVLNVGGPVVAPPPVSFSGTQL